MGAEADDGVGQIAVCGTELFSPLRDDVGLVNHEKTDFPSAQLVHHEAVLEAFGRGDHDPGAAVQL